MVHKIPNAPVRNIHELQVTNFDPKSLIVPALLCFWLLPFITFSPPDDWRVSRFGTAPVLPPIVLKGMKFFGRGGAIGLMCFCLLSVWKHKKRRYVIGIMSPLLSFAAYGMFSTAWSALKTISLQQSATFTLLLMIATYIGIIWRSDRDTERIVKHLVFAISSLSVVLVALHFGMPRSGALTKESSGVLHSTNACAAGGLCIVLTLAARLLWRSAWTAWWFPIVAVETTMMLVAGNRLSVVVTAITLMFLFALALNRGLASLLLLAGTLSISGYMIADPNLSLLEKAFRGAGVYAKQGQTKSQIGSLSGRAEMWEKMWKSFKESPVVGHGYFVTTRKGRIYVWHEWGNWTAHNVALQTLVTMGSVGLSLLIAGFGTLAMGTLAGLKALKDIENSMSLLLVTSVWFFGWGFLNSSFIGPLQPESVVFAALVGIAAGIGGSTYQSMDHEFAETAIRDE